MVSAYENDIRQPSFESLLKIANYFKVSLDFLFDVGGSEYIDVSGLLTSQKTIVYEIVKSYREKNTKELLAAINENTRQGRADFS